MKMKIMRNMTKFLDNNWMLKVSVVAACLQLSIFNQSSTCHAQTQTGIYMPGVSQEGAIYFLPKTAVRVTILTEKTVYTPGDFALYAERYLRLKGVSNEPSTTNRILSISQTAIGVRDTAKAYNVKFNNKTSAINVALADDGVILALNAKPTPQDIPAPFKPAPKPAVVNPRQFLNEEILAAGSTAKMGAGTNCQDRLIALHDLDCPWRPGDLEQRSGRIVRQGNMNPDVQIYRYATEGTFDSYLWQTVENKQKFISQIMTSKSPVRSCDDIDEAALSYAEIKALCAGDPAIKEKMDLDVDVARLRLMKADHQSQQYRLEDRLLKYFPQEIERNKGYLSGFEQDLATAAAHPLPEKDFIGMTIGGETFTEAKDAGEAILDACKHVSNEKDHALGEYRGFSMSVMYNPLSQMYQLTLKGAMSHQVELGSDPRGNITRIDNALAGIPRRIQNVENKLNDLNQQMTTAKAELGKPFPQEEELKTKSARLAELDAKLNLDRPAAQAEKKKPEQER